MRRLVQLLGLGLLYVCASPILALGAAKRLQKLARLRAALRAGWVACPTCGHRNAVNALARCRRCGFTEFGSRLYCTACKQTTQVIDCGRCRASIRVW